MKKGISILVLTVTLLLSGFDVQAAGRESNSYNFFMEEIFGSKGDDTFVSLLKSAEDLMKNVKPEDARKLIDFLKEQIQNKKWDSEEGIKEAIGLGEKEFNTTLTEEQKKQILSLVAKIKELGIEPEYILKQAEKIYEKYGAELKEDAANAGKEILKETKSKIKEEVSKSLTEYLSDMVQSVKTFFKGIFNR